MFQVLPSVLFLLLLSAWKEGEGDTTEQLPQETEKTNRQKSFQNPGAVQKIHTVCVCRVLLLQNPYQPLLTSTAGSFISSFLCLWPAAPTLNSQEKFSSTKRGDAPSATGEQKFPGIPQELYRDCTGPPDPAGSWALGHHRSQQV